MAAPLGVLKSAYFASTTHISRYIAYIDRQNPIFGLQGGVTPEFAAAELAELAEHTTVWRHIYSLPQEAAERLCVDRNYMRQVLSAQRTRIAKAYNIEPKHLHLYASWHHKDHHPHVHIVMCGELSSEGFIKVHRTADKAEKLADASRQLKGIITNEIYRNELRPVINAKNEKRQQLNEEIKNKLQNIGNPKYKTPQIGRQLLELGTALRSYKGRLYYGYISPELKAKTDELLADIINQDATAGYFFERYVDSFRNQVKFYNSRSSVVRDKMQAFEKDFFHPEKGKDTYRHNLILRAARERDAKIQREAYRAKNMVEAVASLVQSLCISLESDTRQTQITSQLHESTRYAKLRWAEQHEEPIAP